MESNQLNSQRSQGEIRQNQNFNSYDSITAKVIGSYDAPTLLQFEALQSAYNYFHAELFNSELPPVLLTLTRKAHSRGYYKPYAWLDQHNANLPEISLNPDILWLDPIQVMGVLAHEMVHHQHQHTGKPGYGGYHNIEFAKLMNDIGLECSDTGKPGGKKTGHRMTHFMIEGGLFDQKFKVMPEEYVLPFKPAEEADERRTPQKIAGKEKQKESKNKTKFTCLGCNSSAWGKSSLHIICGQCNEQFIIIDDCGKK